MLPRSFPNVLTSNIVEELYKCFDKVGLLLLHPSSWQQEDRMEEREREKIDKEREREREKIEKERGVVPKTVDYFICKEERIKRKKGNKFRKS